MKHFVLKQGWYNKAACYTMSSGFFFIHEDMVEILLMLKILFTKDIEVEDLAPRL